MFHLLLFLVTALHAQPLPGWEVQSHGAWVFYGEPSEGELARASMLETKEAWVVYPDVPSREVCEEPSKPPKKWVQALYSPCIETLVMCSIFSAGVFGMQSLESCKWISVSFGLIAFGLAHLLPKEVSSEERDEKVLEAGISASALLKMTAMWEVQERPVPVFIFDPDLWADLKKLTAEPQQEAQLDTDWWLVD